MARHLPFSMPQEWYDENVHFLSESERVEFLDRLLRLVDLSPEEPQSVIFWRMAMQLNASYAKISELEDSLETVLGEHVHRFGEWVTCYEAQQMGIEAPFTVRKSIWLTEYREFWFPGSSDLVTLDMDTGACVILFHGNSCRWGFIDPDLRLSAEQQAYLATCRAFSERNRDRDVKAEYQARKR